MLCAQPLQQPAPARWQRHSYSHSHSHSHSQSYSHGYLPFGPIPIALGCPTFIFAIALFVWLTHTKLLVVCQDLSSFSCCCCCCCWCYSWDLLALVQRVAATDPSPLWPCTHLAINTSFMMDNKWLHSRWQIVWFCFHLLCPQSTAPSRVHIPRLCLCHCSSAVSSPLPPSGALSLALSLGWLAGRKIKMMYCWRVSSRVAKWVDYAFR